jgi:hypothetical protein
VILSGGDLNKKALHSLRSFTVIFICCKLQASLGQDYLR